MTQETFVNYEQAQALKSAGFNEPCNDYYDSRGLTAHTEDQERFNSDKTLDIYARPPLWLAHKWLREERMLDIDICTDYVSKDKYVYARKYVFTVWDSSDPLCPSRADGFLNKRETYEDALSDGITSALKFLKKINNGQRTD